jgi:hypothetical protein
MTKVKLTPDVLAYRQGMAELVNQVCEKNLVTGVNRERLLEPSETRRDIPGLSMAGVLEPPRVEEIFSDIWLADGHLDGIIQIHTSEDYGVMNIYVILKDEQGNQIESGYAMSNEYYEDHWGYIPSASPPSGTTVFVQAIAMDSLGGVGILTEQTEIRVE